MKERDRFLTELIGECWHENEMGCHYTESCGKYPEWIAKCTKCGEFGKYLHINFSSPDGFFKLWNWMKEQDWIEEFFNEFDYEIGKFGQIYKSGPAVNLDLVNPDRLANTVYTFLKEKDESRKR